MTGTCDAAAQAAGNALCMFLPQGASLHAGASVRASAQHLTQAVGIRKNAVVTSFDVSGPVAGVFVLLLDEASASTFAERLLGTKEQVPYSEIALGALGEMGNIAASTFLNVIADRVKKVCLPSVPEIQQGTAIQVIKNVIVAHSHLLVDQNVDGLLYDLEIRGAGDIEMWMWFVPKPGALDALGDTDASAASV